MNMKYAGSAVTLCAAGLLAGCGIGAAGNTPTIVFAGSVCAGAPLAGGTLTVTDSSTPARTFITPVLADGTYSINVANGVAPFLFHAQGKNGARAVDVFSASAANGGRVDISPLTSLVAANAAGHDCAVAACMPSIFTAARLTDADMKVQNQLAPLLTQYGLAIADALDSRQGGPAKSRKLVFFKHIAVGGYVYSRLPLEFIKDAATGNWRLAGNQRIAARAKARNGANTFAPMPGASSLGQWLSFSKESSTYPFGATLIMVRGSGISPAVTLEYLDGENGATRVAGAAIVEAVAHVSFLPACPRPAGQPGSCVEVTQGSNGEYMTRFSNPAAAISGQAANNAKGPGA
jgi:hypothetical protein